MRDQSKYSGVHIVSVSAENGIRPGPDLVQKASSADPCSAFRWAFSNAPSVRFARWTTGASPDEAGSSPRISGATSYFWRETSLSCTLALGEKSGCRTGLHEAEALACLGPTAVLAAAVLAAAAFSPPPAPEVRGRFRVAIRGGAGDAAGVGASWIEAGVGVNYNGRFRCVDEWIRRWLVYTSRYPIISRATAVRGNPIWSTHAISLVADPAQYGTSRLGLDEFVGG